MANNIRIKAQVQDQASGKLGKMRDEFDRLGKSKGFMSVAQGVGVGVGIGALGMLQGAIGGVTDALGAAIRNATVDEQSQARLYQAVAENTTAWDGNRAAIEAVIAERQKLAFSDTEQRDSLALLVARTGDMEQALRISAVAMDLARLKGTDLATSTRAIVMGMEGQGRALKELGINVGDMTDKSEVLARVQEKAAGQAEIYGNTTAGAMEAAQLAIDDAVESIGYKLLPTIKELAFFVRDTAIPAMDGLTQAVDIAGTLVDPLGAAMNRAKGEMADMSAEAERLHFEKLAEGAEGWDTYAEASANAREESRRQVRSIGGVQTAANDLQRELENLITAMEDTARAARDNSLDKHYDLSTIDDQIILAKGDVKRARKELEKAQTDEQKAAARIRLADAERELTDLRNKARDMKADFGKAGALLGESLGSKLYNEVVRWNTLTRREIAALGGTVPKPPKGSNENPERRASGGPVHAGRPYWVGEEGAELFVPHASGSIVPTEQLVPGSPTAAAIGGTAPVYLAVYLDSDEIAARVERRSYFAASIAPVSVR